jgi:hypothetical protein
MACKLQVFKYGFEEKNSGWAYRFAVVDSSKSPTYPANFVCMLPTKINQGKGKIGSMFGQLYGEKSLDFALSLLNDALKSEHDVAVKAEIERRIKLIEPVQVSPLKCSVCKKIFQPQSIKKYRQNLCSDCLKKRCVQRP